MVENSTYEINQSTPYEIQKLTAVRLHKHHKNNLGLVPDKDQFCPSKVKPLCPKVLASLTLLLLCLVQENYNPMF